MKKLTFFIQLALLTLTCFGQNNPPIAVSDTFYLNINDTLVIEQQTIYYGIHGATTGFLINDSDPDGDRIYADTSFYSGAGNVSDSLYNPIPSIHKFYIAWSPPLNFLGIDSVNYIIYDDGNPVMYDTATIYIFVKRPEYETLNVNNVNAMLGLNSLFYNHVYTISAFEVPKGSGSNTIFAANLWVAGKNQNSVFSSNEIFGHEFDYGHFNWQNKFNARSGPIMDATFYEKYSYKWDRHWKITADEIDYHINNWNTGGYQPIDVIENWPAHGDINKGQAANLAPFIDNNNDGFYNPLDGDYPKIKGQQAVYFIYNDIRYHPASDNPMSIEVHSLAYAYNCPSDSAINNTVFLDYTIYNRSNLTYDSTYIGMWTDFDLGNASDDFVGCDIKRASYYVYNGDNNDENTGGVIGYGSHTPAQGVAFLKGAPKDNDGLDNPFTQTIQDVIDSSGTPYAGLGLGFGDDTIDNEYWGMEHFSFYNNSGGPRGGPQNGQEYYNYLCGKWKDGSQMVWGATGHASSGGTVPAKYIFPGNSDPLLYGTEGVTTPPSWSEFNGGPGQTANAEGDRRGLGSTGPFTFEPDSSVSITLAYVFGRDYQNTGSQAGIVVMQERIDSIRSYYLNDFNSVCGGVLNVSEKVSDNNRVLIYPNPFKNQFTINYELENNTALLEVFNVMGKKIQSKTITQNATIVDLSIQPKGFYFVTINDGTNRISKKIVKQ